MKKYLLIFCALLLAVVGTLAVMLANTKTENKRLEANQAALMSQCEAYQTESGLHAMEAKRLELSYNELVTYYNEIAERAKDMRIQLNRLQSASDAGTDTQVEIQTVLRDSIVFRDRVQTDTVYKYIDTIKAFRWSDPWILCNGNISADSIKLHIASSDTITQFVHRIPKRWWFFRWGTKAIQQDIVCSNPHTKLTYSKYIELKK